jgi:hypothetical protein
MLDRFLNMRALHDQYGPVVRISRTVLSVADKDMLKQVLVTDDLKKGTVYDNTACKGSNFALWHIRRGLYHEKA